MHADGLRFAEISRNLGIPLQTISRWVGPVAQRTENERRSRLRNDPGFKDRARASQRKYSQRPEIREKNLEYSRRPDVLERKRLQRNDNAESKARRREYLRQRYSSNLTYRIMQRLSSRVRGAMRRGVVKSVSTQRLLGCSPQELIERWNACHGSNWATEGNLHIDHVRPCSSFDLADPAQQQVCFNWRNLQLLPAEENVKKKDLWTAACEARWIGRMRELGFDGRLFPVFADEK